MAPPRRPSWEQNYALRRRFERAAYAAYPSIRRSATGHRKYARVVYSLIVPVQDYEPRLIEMQFRRTSQQPALTRVYADGPTESPHRYAPHDHDPQQRSSLCIWYPDDPPERRWVPSDGLLTLIEMTRLHLFKEAYYRETGEWLGDEVPHHSRPQVKAC
ncbi:MAG TPA: hypothetical protein VMT10_14145 [Solirubrobacteraceae bacterium]|nr:hypothetical protein [Solirubrobacteraceae bacterium]